MTDPPASLVGSGERTTPMVAARPWVLAAAAILAMQGYLVLDGFLPLYWAFAAPVFLGAGLFGLFCVFARWDRRTLASYGFFLPRPPLPALFLAAVLVVICGVVSLEPGLTYGFQPLLRPSVAIVGITLVLAPMTALGQESVFRGFVMGRLLTPGHFSRATYSSAALFALGSTNLVALLQLGPIADLDVVILTTLPTFALGILLAVYYFRTGRGLFGPIAFRTGLILWTLLFPLTLGPVPWVVVFVSDLLAYGTVLLFVIMAVPEPKNLARKYLSERFGPKRDRFLLRMRQSHRARRSVVLAVALCVGGIAVVAGVMAGLGTVHPLLAIESGSMAPTFVRGDLVVIEHVPASEIGVGTIVAYSTTCLPSPVVHRVIAINATPNGPVYTTKGDHNPSPDRCPVPYGAVLGRVILIVPAVGYFVLYPQLTIALLILAVVLAVFLNPGTPSRFPRQRSQR